MSVTITSTSQRITISGNYKAFTSNTGSTSTVIQYSSGDAPASGDAGRFLLWKNGSNTGNWEVRYIESATSSTVTVGDGGFSSAPASGEDFAISTNLADIDAALADTIVRSSGRSYQIIDRDFELTSNAFVADVNASLSSKSTQTGSGFIATYPVADNCVLQFGRLVGGEANDSIETIEGCHLLLEVSNNTLMFTNQGSFNSAGCVLNFYGCLIESIGNGFSPFIRAPGPMRIIGCVLDGPMGGRLYSSASELVDTRFSGNLSGGVAWSLGASFTRAIDNAFFYQNQAAIKSYQGFTGTFSNTRFADSNTYIIEAAAQSGLLFSFIDCTTFDVSKINNNTGNYEQLKSINYTVTDSNGTGLSGVKVAVYDNTSTIQDAIRTSSSGNVNTINARFFRKSHNVSTPTNYAPFDIRIRKYGYQYQDFQSAVSEPIKQEFRLPANTVTVLSEASAGALTFITIDFTLKTVTVERERTLSEIYDYCQSQLALDANMDEQEFLTSLDGNVFTFADDWDLILDASGKIGSATGKTLVFGGTGVLQMLDSRNMIDNLTVDGDVDLNALATPLTGVVADAIDFDTAGTYTLDACTITEVTNSSGGAITLNLTNGSTVTTNTGPNITLEQSVNITASNIIDGSRVQIYNVTKSAEIDNSVVSGGSGYSTSVNLLSASVDDGDTIRLRATYTSGTSAKSEALATGIIGITGLSFLTTQDDDTAYNTLALDGSTITKFTADYVNDEVDISVASDFTLAEFYAWWAYNLTTSQGVSDFFGGVTAIDEANFRINNSVVNIYLDNATATNISQTDNRRLYRVDGARPVVSSTSGGGGIDVEWRSPVTIAASESIQSNLSNILDDTNELQQNQGDWLTATGFSTFDPASDQVTVSTNNDKVGYSLTTADKDDIVDRNWDEPLTGATHNIPTSAGRRLRQASAWLSAEGQVTGTPTTTVFATNLTETNTSFYADQLIVMTSGSLAGQARIITNYNGTTKEITVDESWTFAPSASDEFAIFANHVHSLSQIKDEVDQALIDYDGPTRAEATSDKDEIIVEVNANETKIDSVQSSVDGLNDFNPVTDTVANVTTVQTTVTNTDMRGTDGANTIVPDNAGITNNGLAIAALNDVSVTEIDTELTSNHGAGSWTTGSGGDDAATIYSYFTTLSREDVFKSDVSGLSTFDPALDTVANVTTVQTTITNSDMRGTDGANVIVPDNAGIAANGLAIANLNDFNPSSDQVIVATNNDKSGYTISGTKTTLDALQDISSADVKSQADQSLVDYNVDTKTHIKPSISL